MQERIRIIFMVIAVLLCCRLDVSSQHRGQKKTNRPKPERKQKSKKAAQKKLPDAVKRTAFTEITDSATVDEGVFTVYRKKNDYYFLIPDSLMGRDFLIVNKISGVPANFNDAGFCKGMNYENLVVRFSVNEAEKKVFVWHYRPLATADEASNIGQSVRDNYAKSILEYFDLSAYNADSSGVLINVNKVYDGSSTAFNNIFGISNIGTSPIKSHSYIEKIRSFPKNIVVKSVQTTQIPAAQTAGKLSVSLTSNLVLLPKVPMTPRFEDSRVGFFSTPRWYFTDRQHRLEKRKLITRWRMIPKDKAKYLRGELSEPTKPIIFYIDPATPEQWKKYIIAGVHDWQEAFEEAGFKNAILAKNAPADDADFDVDDLRYSVITYVASEKANAMGPSVFDPRSGEILEADVVWWHNVMTSVHSWLRVQTGATDPNARANQVPEALMGEAIRFVSSHEVGHTLGLKHNMGASYAFPTDSLRSPTFYARQGVSPSIMDYARFNYVAQAEDKVKHLVPKIGVYDKFAIAWGYRYYPEEDAHKEIPASEKYIAEAYKDPQKHYLAQQDMRTAIDPRAQSEDLGDDAVKASEYGLKNLQRIKPQILAWTTKDGESYLEAGKLLNAIIGQWHLYAYHVLTHIGGIHINQTVSGDGQKSYTCLSPEKQRKALDYLLKHVVSYPEWLFEGEIYQYTYPVKESPEGPRAYHPFTTFKNMQNYIMWDLLADQRLERMIACEVQNKTNAYPATELLHTLYAHIFSKTLQNKTLSIPEQATQKNFVDALIIAADRSAVSKEKKRKYKANTQHFDATLIFKGPARTSQVASIKRGILLKIEELLKKRQNTNNAATKYHYQDLLLRIASSLY